MLGASITINCDMGEAFGLYQFGQDEHLSPYIQLANIGCGFHGSDPNHMRATVRLAKRFGLHVGAHPSLPDLQGFGRREMQMSRDELANILIYQIGALAGFLTAEGMVLHHIKPHGALYGMAARQRHIAEAICDAADVFQVPLLGLTGTLHEEVFAMRGHRMVAEFFADLDYDDEGRLLITREHPPVPPEWAAARCLGAVRHGTVMSVNGRPLPVTVETICVHSDTPNAVDVVQAIAAALGITPSEPRETRI